MKLWSVFRRNWHFSARVLLLLLLAGFWCWFSRTELAGSIENKLIDFRFRYRGEIDAPVKLVYVDIDTDAIQQYGWPWDHGLFAQLVQALFVHGQVKAVGIDVVFSENGEPRYARDILAKGRTDFGRAIHTHRNVVLAANYVPGPGTMQKVRQFPFIFDGFTDPAANDIPEGPTMPIAGPTWGIIGLIDTYRGETRAAPAFADTMVGTFYPFALQLALLHWELGPDAVHRFPDRMEIRRPDDSLVTSIPLRRGQLIEVNWFSHWISEKNPRAGVADIGAYLTQLQSEDPEDQARGQAYFDQFKDAIVMIGPVDVLLQDLATTSFDDAPVPQVGLHGNLLKTLVSGTYLRHVPLWVNDLLIVVLGLATAGLAIVSGPRSAFAKVLSVLVVLAYTGVAFHLFAELHLLLPVFAPVGAALTSSFAGVLWQVIEEQRQKSRIKGMFGAYVSPQLVERMVESGEDPHLGGHEEEITAYFSDIQSFSSFSEKLPPDQLVELMNEYLTACTDIVQEEGGTLDKYIGDAVVAMFGAPIALPDHAYRACVATQRVHSKLRELREKWTKETGRWPDVVSNMQSRIGLNTGRAIIGNMGSRTRFNYTMMGDNVNLAARMESGAKSWGVYTMVTETTRLACEQHGGDHLIFRPLGRIVVMGRSQPVPIFEIVGLKEEMNAGILRCIDLFSRGLDRYYERDWEGARRFFQESSILEPNQPGITPGVKSNPSQVYLNILAEYEAAPPDSDWDGVYVMKQK